jgi:hypothetical protein
MSRPNIHVGIHYPEVTREYGLPVNVNVLVREGLHRSVYRDFWGARYTSNSADASLTAHYRVFEKRVYETNYSNIEKLLLKKLNIQIAVRFALDRGFFIQDAELTMKLGKIRQTGPTVIDIFYLSKNVVTNFLTQRYGCPKDAFDPQALYNHWSYT